VIDRMDGTAATTNLPANDRHILAYLKTVLAKLGLEGTNHKFRHSFCTIAVLAGVDFFTLRRWVGHIDEEALKIYVHIADEEAQVTMRQLAERRQAAGRAAKPARGRKGISKVSAKSPRGGAGRVVDQQSFSKVTEVTHDTLFKEPWKQGLFDSTITNQRRGRDSNPRSSF
jgi:hypothetical protein